MRGGDYFILSCTLLLFSTPSWALQTGGVPDIHTEFTDRQGRPTDPVTLDFGCREVGSPRLEFSFSLENRTPGSELTLFSVSNRDPSFIVTTQQTFPVRVSSGNAVRVSVSFVPQGTGLIEDRVSIRSNDPDEPEFVVHMNGIGSDSSSPCADFRWAPAVPSVGEEVQFFDNSKFAPIKAWDFDGDGSVDSTEESPLHVFDASGFHPVMLTASSESGGSVSATHTLRVESVGPPSIRFVSREFEGLFVEGVDSAIPQNRFTPDVRWNGSTGELRYSINDGPQTSSCCSMSEFPARFSPSQVTITAVRDGLSSDPWKEEVHVFPFPTWVTRAGLADLDFESSGETVITHFRSEVPRPRLGGFLLDIPAEVPLLGGQFGVAESFAGLDGTFYSGTGTGFFRLSGATAFQAMGDRVEGRAWGGGSFKIGASTGLEATSGALSFSLAGTITRTQGIAEVIPKLRELENRKVIGKAIKAFNEIVTLEGQISPSMRLDTQFAQHGENLEFNEGEGALGLGLKTTVRAEVLNVTAEAWLGGHGEITLGVPEPFLRKVELAAQAGVSINIDFLISAVEEDATVNLRCSWEPGRGNQMDCRFGSGASSAMLTAMGQDELLLKVIRVNYDRFGPYAAFRPTLHPLAFNPELPYDLRQSTLVSNVFPGASPFTVEIPGAQLLLWEFQDLDDPVLQSTEIAFSLNDGSGWTQPALIEDDTRVELDPVAGVAPDGRVVAAWLRVKDPAFTGDMDSLDDLAGFLNQLEVVSSVFDPQTRSWSEITQVTQDARFDNDLKISSDVSGNLLMSWLSNSSGEYVSSAESPSTLYYSIWDDAGWSHPLAVESGLQGVATHVAAVNGSRALIVMPRDPNPEIQGDGVLDLYEWTGAGWSERIVYASGGNSSPTVVFDTTGEGHIVWVRGTDLVHATISRPVPEIVRTGGDSLGFHNSSLHTNLDGNLTLLWQQAGSNGPADLFALIFDPDSGSWSADRQLSQDDHLNYAISAYYGSDGALHLAYLASEVIRDSKEILIEGELFEVGNIPSGGRTDLRTMEHSLLMDLAISDDDLQLSVPEPRGGEELTARATVYNAGDFPVSGFEVGIYAGEPGDTGTLLASRFISMPLAGGERAELELTFTYPGTGGDIVLVVDSGEAITEFSEENNRVVVALTNSAPIAVISSDVITGLAPLTVSLTASASLDPDGQALGYEWNFGDSTTTSGDTVDHTFTQPGTYPVTLTVTDTQGAIGTAVTDIQVNPGRFYFPFLHSQEGRFTGYAVSNFSDTSASLQLSAYSPDGTLTSSLTNPNTVTLLGGQQLAKLGRDLFGVLDLPSGGWVEMVTDNPDLASFFQFGSNNLDRLDGSVAALRFGKRLYFSRVYSGLDVFFGEEALTHLSIVNPTDQEVQVRLRLSRQGESSEVNAILDLPARGSVYEPVHILLDQPIIEGRFVELRVLEGEGVVAFALMELPRIGTVIGLEASTASSSSVAYSAQLASLPGALFTDLNIVNIGNQAQRVTLRAINDDGSELSQPVQVDIPAFQNFRSRFAELFALGSDQAFVGSLRVEAESSGILGDVLFGTPSLNAVAALPLQTESFRRAIFSHVANITPLFTGVAVYNTSASKAKVTLTVFSNSGTKVGSVDLDLEPGARLAKTVVELVPMTAGQAGGYIVIESNEPLVAQQVFGDAAGTLLSAVPPRVVR